MKIRPMTEDDREEWLRMRKALWPQHDPDELRAGVAAVPPPPDREAVFVAEREGAGSAVWSRLRSAREQRGA